MVRMRVSRVVFLALVLLLNQCASTLATTLPRPTRVPVSPELAVQFALEALHSDSAAGRLIGNPTVMRGQVMSLADAYSLVNGKALDYTSPLNYRRDQAVWLVVTRGDWLLHIPGGHGNPAKGTPTLMAKDVTVAALWNAITLMPLPARSMNKAEL